MGKRHRFDTPGTYHHVVNRAIARRPLFESRAEGRYFIAQLARRVRAGQLEVLAYSLMTTHFHLLVRSPVGELSDAMRMATNAYSRWFNRRHRRDGPLFRGRFISRKVGTLSYRIAVLRYIDMNAVHARIVAHPADYALGSARRYASSDPGPWLSSGWIRSYVDETVGGEGTWASKYRALCASPVSESVREMVDARLRVSGRQSDLLDELVDSAPPKILEWMRRKSKLADGGRLHLPVAGPSGVGSAIASNREALDTLAAQGATQSPSPRAVLHAALLRTLAGSSLAQIALALGVTEMTVRRHIRTHERFMEKKSGAYAAIAEEVARGAIAKSADFLRPA